MLPRKITETGARPRAPAASLTEREARLLHFWQAEAATADDRRHVWTRAGWLSGDNYRRHCRREAARLIEQAREETTA